jgi:hypothetical protein
MFIMQTSSMSFCRGITTVLTRWHRLIEIASDPYRPELYYMRGPGPKWRAKHLRPTENGSF